ncbi:hypothetical protein ACO0R3_000561 [Hanseniaspora guilliermondii]
MSDNNSTTSNVEHERNKYYINLVKKHIHDNSQYNKVWKKYATTNNNYQIRFDDLIDNESFLRKYKDKYKLNSLQDNRTFNGELLQTPLGRKTESYKKNNKSKITLKKVDASSVNDDDVKTENHETLANTGDESKEHSQQPKFQTLKEKERNRLLIVQENLDNTIIHGNRTSKKTLVDEVTNHFKNDLQVKEAETLSQFIYKVKKDNRKFKLEF